MSRKIVVAGGSGNLGSQICVHLNKKGADVHVLLRKKPGRPKANPANVTVHQVDFENVQSLVDACRGATCIVSALSGIRDVIIDAQTNLADAALKAGVPRFIPSDYCIDYRKLIHGRNRNLDIRREFSTVIDTSGLQATSILNGMFTELLREQAPVILKKQKRIFFWGNADQKMDFTSMKDTAAFTAEVALDDSSPRWLYIAGEEASMRDIKGIAERLFKESFKFLRPGGLKTFQFMINVTKTFAPGRDQVFPPWQGMQYLHDMLSGLPKHNKLDNARYANINWDSIEAIMKSTDDAR